MQNASRLPTGGVGLLNIDKRYTAGTGDLRQNTVPLFKGAKFKYLRIGTQGFGFHPNGFRFSPSFGYPLVRLEFDLLQLVLSRQRRLLGSHLGLDRAVKRR